MIKFIFSFIIFLAVSSNSWAQTGRSVVDRFVADVMRCGSQLGINIDSNIAGSVSSIIAGTGADGEASIEFSSFLTLFPERDRLKAYQIYAECLTGIYETVQDRQILIIGERNAEDIDYPNFTNRSERVSAFLDINNPDAKQHDFLFSVTADCQLSIEYSRSKGMGFSHYYRLLTPFGTRMASSNIGSNSPPDRVDLVPGNYIFRLLAHRGAGKYWVDLQTIC